MKLALILGFCMALASASLPGFEEWGWENDMESGINHCQISSRKVKTLDNVKMPINLPNCYTVLLKDCSSDPKFVVMMRKLSPNTDLKEIKILTRTHKIVLTPSTVDNRMRVIVNGQERPMMNREIVLTVNGYPLRIVKEEGHQLVKIESMRTGLKLSFNGHLCDIKLPEVTRQVMPLCGLCKPTTMEMTTPFHTMTTMDSRSLLVKYITNDCRYNKFQTTEDECHGFFCPNKRMSPLFWTEQDHETCTDNMYTTPYEKFSRLFTDKTFDYTPRMFTEETMYTTPKMFTEELFHHQTPRMFTEDTMYTTPNMFNEELLHQTPRMFDNEEIFGEHTLDYSTGKHDYTTYGKRPMLKHKIVERGDEVCVSMVRIPQCPLTTVPEMKLEKRVPYTCVYRNDPRVWKYETRIRNGERIPEILRSTPSMTRTEVIPVKCTPLY